MIKNLNQSLELEIYFNYIKENLYKKFRLKFFVLSLALIIYIAIPGFHIPSLEYTRTRISGVMEERALENFLLFYPSQNWLNYDEIPDNIKRATLALEDDGFFYHKGIDWKSLQLASRINLRRGKIVRGGSTITMQTAKNIYFTTSRNYFRKAKEILTAMRMEKELPKQTILEHYLNIVELGDGIFGVQSASKKFFKKNLNELNKEQMARIVAILPSPLRHSPVDNSRFVIRRKNLALSKMSSIQLME
ncbi:MAG: transglycosylase domain-containing protein [Ignavibacteria bacterium]|nr:transglycosylase domain-containing protein [Ignavibacteria bacterium]